MSDPSGTPGRYARTTQGLIASMLVSVAVVVVVFLLLRLDNGNAEQGPEKVDYLDAVTGARDAGLRVVYPPTLPEGWKATSVDYEPGRRPAWGIGALTDSGTFAGVHQEDEDVDDLLATYVDEDPRRGDDIAVDSPLATTWASWSDSGGDHAYTTQIQVDGASETVLVYGSASRADLTILLESLVLG